MILQGPSYSSSQTRTLVVCEKPPSGPAYFRVSEPRTNTRSIALVVVVRLLD